MKVQKISLKEDLSIDFECIAIHSNIEDYQLAYLINKHLKLRLKRSEEDLDIYNGHFKFPLYEWEDVKQQNKWNLISNFIYEEVIEAPHQQELFEEKQMQIKKQFLLSEYKKVDYFLRISQFVKNCCTSTVVDILNKIPQIVTCYQIDLNKIKHIENLTLE